MIKLKTCTTAAAFICAVAVALATTQGEKTVRGAMLTAWGDSPGQPGSCNQGTMPTGCSTTVTLYGVCTVTFSDGFTDDAHTLGCVTFYYKTDSSEGKLIP